MKFHILSTSKREYSCESLNIYTKETDRLIGVENGGLRDGKFSRDNGKKSIWCRSRCNIKNLNKDREKALLQIVDLTEKFMGNNFSKEAYDGARAMIKNPDHKWMRYVNRLLDETDPHVAKMTALNLGFQAAFLGTKTIRKMRKCTTVTFRG